MLKLEEKPGGGGEMGEEERQTGRETRIHAHAGSHTHTRTHTQARTHEGSKEKNLLGQDCLELKGQGFLKTNFRLKD